MKKRSVVNGLIILLVLAGAALLAYPYVSFRLSEHNQSYVIQQYDDSLEQLTEEQLQEEWSRAQAYNEALHTSVLYDPFASGRQQMDEEYLSRLNIDENGVMCRVRIPRINVDMPVYHGTSFEVLEKGGGHLEGSALPVGGEGNHAVLTAHTGLNSAKLFTGLTELAVGDEFYVYTLDRVLAYRIDQITVVEPADSKELLATPGKDYVTLVTCTPYGINSHRLLVRGERVDYSPEKIEQIIHDTDAVASTEIYMLYAGISLLFVLILVILILEGRKKQREKSKTIIRKTGGRDGGAQGGQPSRAETDASL